MATRILVLVSLLAGLAAGCGDKGQESCPADRVDCDGVCVDAQTDADHCGDCETACGADQACVDGRCEDEGCAQGLTDCSGDCVDTNSDPDHCGECEIACPDGVDCVEGDCDVPCPSGEILCGESCVDTDVDPDNCGDCGHGCDPGEACVDGGCVGETSLPAERQAEPIVISGADLPNLNGIPVQEVFVYAFTPGAGWHQIPHQVDERAEAHLWSGSTCPLGCELRYVFDGEEGDGLDADDELVFMARDVGARADGAPPAGTTGDGHEIRVALPGGEVVGYAYAFAAQLDKDFGGPRVVYSRSVVDADTEDTLVQSLRYQVHFSRLWVMDELSVQPAQGGDGTDLLDRWKGRAYSRSLSGETEDIVGMCGGWSNHAPDWGEHTYIGHIDGPVRAIREIQGACSWPNLTRVDVFYEATARIILNIRGHSFGQGDNGLWGYWDWDQAAGPMTYYNPAVMAGTAIDGVEDPAYPNADSGQELDAGWDQVDSAHGGVVFAFQQTLAVPGPVRATFLDDATWDDSTGDDPGVYGGNGFHILYIASTEPMLGDDPAQVIFTWWPMAGDSGAIGGAYAQTAFEPLRAEVDPD